MAKPIIQDIKRDRPSLRDVLPKKGAGQRPAKLLRDTPRAHPTTTAGSWPVESGLNFRRIFIWFLATVAVIAALYVISLSFRSAVITIKPKQATITVNEIIRTVKETTGNDLTFRILSGVEASERRELPAGGLTHVEQKASGQIAIYNSYSTAPQILIANTRFATADGKIYRIASNITIPGLKKEAGETIPGKIEVTVFADKPGADYNIGLTDFTIPGFKGSPQFTAFKVRSVTPLAGGFVGSRRAVDAATRSKAEAEIKLALQTKLFAAAKEKTPANFIFYNDGVTLNYQLTETEGGGATSTTILLGQGSLQTVLFDRQELSKYLALKTLADFDGSEEVLITNIANLEFKRQDKEWPEDLTLLKTMTFNLTGQAKVVWQINQEELKKKLAGQSKASYPSIFDSYRRTIAEVKIRFRPPWSGHFPTNPAKIKIIIEPA